MYWYEKLGYPRISCTVSKYAKDIWIYRKTNGILRNSIEVSIYKPGDIVVFKEVPNVTPYSHIAIFDSDIDDGKTLEHWEEQGVFLLNSALTVEDQKPGSHMKIWSTFISKVITFIAFHNPCVWLLWGKPAQKLALGAMRFKDIETFDFSLYKKEDISTMPFSPYYNYILTSAHPAAEVYIQNAGFLGNDHFIKTNALLSLKNKKIINW